MDVQNISGNDIMPTGFSAEYSRPAEPVEVRPAPEDQRRERSVDENRGQNLDVTG